MKTTFPDFIITLFVIIFSIGTTSCSDDEPSTPPSPVANFEFAVSIEDAGMVTFTNTSENADSFVWEFGENGATSTDANPTYTYSSSGTYTVTLTATGEGGANTTDQEINVTGTAVTADFNFTVSANNNGTVTFENTSTGADTYSWDFGDESGTSTEENPTHVYGNTGTYTVTLSATGFGGTNETTKMVGVTLNIVVAEFEFVVAGDDSGKVSFTNNSSNGNAFSWEFGDGSTSTDANPVHTYSESGRYTVTLNVTGDSGSDNTSNDVVYTVNLVTAGDMSDDTQWTFKQIWNDPDNAIEHSFVNETFTWDNAAGTLYSQSYLWQEVALEAGKTYTFSADVTSTTGTSGVWFELYFGKDDPDLEGDYGSNEGANGKRLDAGCVSGAYDGNYVELVHSSEGCGEGDRSIASDGNFTISAEELTANGTIYLVFKSGSWDSADNYGDGLVLDNVSIREVF